MIRPDTHTTKTPKPKQKIKKINFKLIPKKVMVTSPRSADSRFMTEGTQIDV
jgi:hypothetical protein